MIAYSILVVFVIVYHLYWEPNTTTYKFVPLWLLIGHLFAQLYG